MLDSTNLERNLISSASLIDAKIKMIMALNMQDEAKSKGFSIDFKILLQLLICIASVCVLKPKKI